MVKNKDIEKQKQHFESVAGEYINARNNPRHALLQNTVWEIFWRNGEMEKWRTNFIPAENLNILEAMCGRAELYEILKKYIRRPFSFNAFDYSDTMVTYAQQLHPELLIWQQDVTTFRNREAYDIIFIIGGLHHVYAHKERVLKNIADSLRPGGLFISSEPTYNNPLFYFVRDLIYRKNKAFDHETEKAFTTKELNTLAGDCGLDLITQLNFGLLAYILWQNPEVFPSLNKGGVNFAKYVINIEKIFWKTRIARFFSFATLSAYRKR